MKRLIHLLKIFSAISFLLVMVPQRKLGAVPMGFGLLANMLGAGTREMFYYSIVVFVAFCYLLIFGAKRTRLHDLFSLIAIVLLIIPVFVLDRIIFDYNVFISFLTLGIFIVISFSGLILIVKRILQNNYS